MKEIEEFKANECFYTAERLAKRIEARHPNPPDNFTDEEVDEINYWYLLAGGEQQLRNYSGATLELVSFVNRCVEIEMYLPHPIPGPQPYLPYMHHRVESLLAIRYLSRAQRFVVHVYVRPPDSDEFFFQSPREAKFEIPDFGMSLFQKPLPDTKISEWRGELRR